MAAHTTLAPVWLVAAAALGAALPALCLAQSAPSAGVEGDWVRTDTLGSGDFGDLTSGYQQAQLTAAAAAALAQSRDARARSLKPLRGAPHAAGQGYVVVQQPCAPQNNPANEGDLGISPDSTAIHIVVSKYQAVIAPERDGLRVIYLDGRPHPPLALLMPTAAGHSVGHFEGRDLVVDTVGFATGPVPAGGWRTARTHLTERYTLSADGRHLSVHYTWTDPAIYVKPHSYLYTFDRLPAGSYAFEYWCDPRDSAQYTSIVPPAQR